MMHIPTIPHTGKKNCAAISKYGLTQYVNLDESIAKSVFSELTKTFKYPKETFEKFLDAYRGDMSVISDYVEEIQYMYS